MNRLTRGQSTRREERDGAHADRLRQAIRRRSASAADIAVYDATIALLRTLLYYSPETVRVIQSVTRHALERQQALDRDRVQSRPSLSESRILSTYTPRPRSH
jgi:hypothetical protein